MNEKEFLVEKIPASEIKKAKNRIYWMAAIIILFFFLVGCFIFFLGPSVIVGLGIAA